MSARSKLSWLSATAQRNTQRLSVQQRADPPTHPDNHPPPKHNKAMTSPEPVTSEFPTSWSTGNFTGNATLPEGWTTPPPAPPRPSLEDILKQFPDYQNSLALGLYGCSAQIALGSVTNLLTIAVMTRRTMIASTTCLYFALLAASDLLVLYSTCLRRLLYVVNDHRDVYIRSAWSCRFIDFFSYFSYDLSSWILTAMTADRFIAIRYPLKAATVCTIRNAGIITATIVVVCVTKNFHFFFTSTVTERSGCLPEDEHRDFLDDVWPWIDATFYSFLPFSLLFIFNILIIHYHRMALRRKRSLHACGSRGRASPGARPEGFNQRLTIMLLVVSFTFMALTAPKVILIIVRQDVFVFFPSPGHIDFATVARYSLVSSIFNFLLWTNHTLNFFLYCLSGKRFRQEFLRMLAPSLCCKRHTRVFVSSQPRGRGQGAPPQRRESSSSTRRGSNSSVVSDDVAPVPAQLPTETEDALSRVNRWAMVTFEREQQEDRWN